MLLVAGSPLDPELVAESERNIRKLEYLGTVRIIPSLDEESGAVDLEVCATDRLPWIVLAMPTVGGGRFDLDYIFSNLNFLGTGIGLGTAGRASNEQANQITFFCLEPRIANSRWNGSFLVGQQGDLGMQYAAKLERPLYRIASRWALSVGGSDQETEGLFYGPRVILSKYSRRLRGGSIDGTRRFGGVDRLLDLSLSISYEETRSELIEGDPTLMPVDKERGRVGGAVSAERFRFVETSYVNNLGPVEDFKLGPWGTFSLGYTSETLGSDREYPDFGLSAGIVAGSPARSYVTSSAGASARIEGGRLAEIVDFVSAGFGLRTNPRGMVVFMAEGRMLRRMEDPSQLLLDSNNWARGYRTYAYEGTRRSR